MISFARKEDEILFYLKDNNRMLREIIEYINMIDAKANDENNNDFLRNILANLISNQIDRNYGKN